MDVIFELLWSVLCCDAADDLYRSSVRRPGQKQGSVNTPFSRQNLKFKSYDTAELQSKDRGAGTIVCLRLLLKYTIVQSLSSFGSDLIYQKIKVM